MQTIEQLSRKYYPIDDFGYLMKSENQYVKLEERYVCPNIYPEQLCPDHLIILIGFDATMNVVTFGCLSCGYREDWKSEKLTP